MLKKIQPLDNTCYRIARPLLLAKLGSQDGNEIADSEALVDETVQKIKITKQKLIELLLQAIEKRNSDSCAEAKHKIM
jgi:hypothetical protein